MSLDRRRFLAVGAAGVAGAAVARTAAGADPDPRVAFDGEHQAGILARSADHATFVALDAIAADRAGLLQGLQALSRHARNLATGYSFSVPEPDDPPPDSGTLGTTVAPSGLTITIAFGASLFDHRYGLARRRPAGLKAMTRFPDDAIDPLRADGDVLVTLAAPQRDTIVHALRELLRQTRDSLAVRWTLDGFSSATGRNLFGFRDGTSNPAGAALPRAVFRPDGGTVQVVRTIRMHVEFWDRVGLREQEAIIGRTRAGGTRLDVAGAHVELANPRTPSTEAERFLRRSYNFHRGVDRAGQLDQGLIFVAYNADPDRQFEAVQTRLAGEPMTDYATPVGGGYFFAPRGTRDAADWVGSGLV